MGCDFSSSWRHGFLGAIISCHGSVFGTPCNVKSMQMQRFGEENGAKRCIEQFRVSSNRLGINRR